MKKLGITGSSGVLGKLLIKELKKKKILFSSFKGNITKINDIKIWLEKEKNINYIFHFAAYTSVLKSNNNKKKSYRINVLGIRNLVKSIIQSKKKIFLFFPSSSHVYGFSKNPIAEKSKLLPITYYGETKLLAEKELQLLKKYKLNFFIGRIFSIFHKTQQKPFLYPTIKEKIKKSRKKKILIKNGNCIRDFSNAEKIVKIILQVYYKKLSGIYNIGSGKGISIKDFICKNISKKKEIISNDKINVSIANIKKLKKAKIRVI